MTATQTETAFLPFALRESLQPGDLDLLMQRVEQDHCTVTDVIVRALRNELRTPPRTPLPSQPSGLNLDASRAAPGKDLAA